MPSTLLVISAIIAAAFLPGATVMLLSVCVLWGIWGYLTQSRRDVAMALLFAASVLILVPILRQTRIDSAPAESEPAPKAHGRFKAAQDQPSSPAVPRKTPRPTAIPARGWL